MIKVLIVEDSAVARELLAHILASDPEVDIIGMAANGQEALATVLLRQPDVITMDINMPKLNGFEATRQIMESHPTPIVIVSASWDVKEVATTFRALEAGALALVARPPGPGHADHPTLARELVQTVKLMSEVKVVRRWGRQRRRSPQAVRPPVAIRTVPAWVKVVALGASTGGPVALQTILAGLPQEFPAPLLVVQHMAAGFLPGFATWLAQSSTLPVYIAAHGDRLRPGHVYLAPDGFQMAVRAEGTIALVREQPENGLCPSVSYLFRSVAAAYGSQAIGVLLTGMGRDGAQELKLLKERGAVTIAQDSQSSIIHGMPGEAIRQDGATYVLSPEEIAQYLASFGEGLR